MSLSRSAPREPWFGAVPVGWNASRLKNSTESVQNGLWGEEAVGDTNDIACVRVADFDRLTLRVRQPVPTTRNLTPKERVGRQLRRDDLLIEKSGGGELQPVGVVVTYDADAPAVCSNFVARIVPRRNTWPRYFAYVHAALYSHGLNKRSIKQTTGIQNLDGDSYFNELAPFPPLPDQQRIADFLDRKTAEIDALIAKKERMIALLNEKRQAVISQAVTTGVSASTSMQHSGVAWLGDVPSHWRVVRLKFIKQGPFAYGANEAADFDNPHWARFVRITDVNSDGTLREETFRSLPDEIAAPYMLSQGDVLLARSGATVGKSFLYRESWGRACYAGYLIRVRLQSNAMRPEFFRYFTASRPYWEEISLGTIQATIQNVSAERYGEFSVPVPPLAEQEQIVSYLDCATEQSSKLISTIERHIALLREYRQALISEAVAGRVGLGMSAVAMPSRAKETVSC